jgi:hypothetical protein
MIITLKDGEIAIALPPDLAPRHVESRLRAGCPTEERLAKPS